MKQYSVDRRERLLGAIDAGLSQAEASRLFGVGTSTITRWRQRASTGALAPKPRPGRTPRIGPAQADALQAQIATDPDATLGEHCATWAREHEVTVSVATMSRAIRRLGITVKTRPVRRRAGCGPARRLVGGPRRLGRPGDAGLR
jgi:transposase